MLCAIPWFDSVTNENSLEVCIGLGAQVEQIDREKHHPAKESENSKNESYSRESVPPHCPKCRQEQKAHKVKIELTSPGHREHIAEEVGEKIPTMVRDRDCGVDRKSHKKHDKTRAK